MLRTPNISPQTGVASHTQTFMQGSLNLNIVREPTRCSPERIPRDASLSTNNTSDPRRGRSFTRTSHKKDHTNLPQVTSRPCMTSGASLSSPRPPAQTPSFARDFDEQCLRAFIREPKAILFERSKRTCWQMFDDLKGIQQSRKVLLELGYGVYKTCWWAGIITTGSCDRSRLLLVYWRRRFKIDPIGPVQNSQLHCQVVKPRCVRCKTYCMNTCIRCKTLFACRGCWRYVWPDHLPICKKMA